MEAPDEFIGSNSNSNSSSIIPVVKGKRTKRQRAPSTAAPTSSGEIKSAVTTTTTEEEEEEEEMANCLILLAQGRALAAEENSTRRRSTEPGLHLYECKTCNKSFLSFQALGGHRASHKKLKIAAGIDEADLQISMNSFAKPIVGPTGNNKSRVHGCSICGSEFSSGQALGGHMRRHRAAIAPDAPEEKAERGFLSLDLNLPAPFEGDGGEFTRSPPVGLTFARKRPMVFSVARTLVDCHY